MFGKYKDISGERFGSLTAIKPTHRNQNGLIFWDYLCDCGKTHNARANTIKYEVKRRGDPELPSCGCVELRRKTKHGYRRAKDTHPAYRSYRGIMTRCYNENDARYVWYGAEGVTVCDEWKDNPEAFIEWSLANGWKPGYHIDKDILCKELNISPTIYSPKTCQWVSPKVNVGFATNRDNYGKHPNVKLSHDEVNEILELYYSGEVTNKSELARMYGLLSPSSIMKIIRKYEESA